MPRERERRKLYGNGLTICIELFFCLFQISLVPQDARPPPKMAGLGLGVHPASSVLTRALAVRNQNVYIYIACQSIFCNKSIFRNGKSDLKKKAE